MCRVQTVLVITLVVKLACSWDIAVTAGDRIELYNIDGTKTDLVGFTSKNLTALAYDEVDDMLLYVDKQSGNDSICGYKISSVDNECYIESNGRNIQDLAFDPVTNTLFFTDTKERSINWYSFDPKATNNAYGNLLLKMDEGIPTEIAVDSCRGYVYWINTDVTPSTIERARFDGSEREVIINATHEWNLKSLAIDQQAQKIYWKMLVSESSNVISRADLNGKNREQIMYQMYYPGDHINAFSVSKQSLLSVSSCTTCNPRIIYQFPKPFDSYSFNELLQVDSDSLVGIVTNYKMKDQLQGISDCKHVFDNDGSLKIVRENEGPFCVYGVKEIGQSLCKCSPGYIGERCDVTVCENFCFQGSCNFTQDGRPECRCNAGYSGERCEINVCNGYCLNNGTCSLSEEDEPICECIGEYEGGRCEVSAGVNNVDGSLNEKVEAACQTRASKFKDDQNNAISSGSKHYTSERNITLADLLANWQKPIATISVVVEVKTNN